MCCWLFLKLSAPDLIYIHEAISLVTKPLLNHHGQGGQQQDEDDKEQGHVGV